MTETEAPWRRKPYVDVIERPLCRFLARSLLDNVWRSLMRSSTATLRRSLADGVRCWRGCCELSSSLWARGALSLISHDPLMSVRLDLQAMLDKRSAA